MIRHRKSHGSHCACIQLPNLCSATSAQLEYCELYGPNPTGSENCGRTGLTQLVTASSQHGPSTTCLRPAGQHQCQDDNSPQPGQSKVAGDLLQKLGGSRQCSTPHAHLRDMLGMKATLDTQLQSRPHCGVCQAPCVQCRARSCMICTWVARADRSSAHGSQRHAGPEHGLLQGLLTQPAKPALLLERLLPRTPATHSAACLSSILRRTCQAAGPLEHWQGITSVSDAAAEKAARCFRAVSGRPPCRRICASSRASSRLRAALRTEPLASAHRLLASLISGSRSCHTQPAAQYWLCAECSP